LIPDPAGPLTEVIARLWWIMAAGAVVVLTLVVALVLIGTFGDPTRRPAVSTDLFIVGGGVILPRGALTTMTDLVPEAEERHYQHAAAIAMAAGFMILFGLSAAF
jgi:ZIP family zinc transporter